GARRIGRVGPAADAFAEAQQPAVEDHLFQRRKGVETDRLDPPGQRHVGPLVGQCPASRASRRAPSSARLESACFLTSTELRKNPSWCCRSTLACNASRSGNPFGSR